MRTVENQQMSARARMDYLDALRIFLTALVVYHHQAIAFGAPGGWYYIVAKPADLPSIVLMTMFITVNQAFFMSFFFFVAAYFTAPSLDRKGPARFLRERLTRLGIPLVVYFFMLNPSLVYFVLRFQGVAESGYFRFMADHALDYVGWGPLWFVLALLIFTFVYVPAAAMRKRRGETGAIFSFPTNKQMGVFVLAIGLFTYCLRMIYPVGSYFIGLQIGYFPLYIAFFVFGVRAYRGAWLERLDGRRAAPWFRLAIGFIVALPAIFVLDGALGGSEGAFLGGLHWQALVYALWEPVVCVGICLKLLVLFRKRFNKAGSLSRSLSSSAYAAYIIHPLFVILATRLARDWPIHPALTFLIISPFVVGTSFVAANVLRQAPGFRRVL